MARADKAAAAGGDRDDDDEAIKKLTSLNTVAEHLKIMSDKFIDNLKKLDDERTEINNGLTKLGNQAPGTNKTFQDWAEQYSNVAYHYFRLIHYTEKLATKRDHMQRIIDYLSSYLEAVSTNTVDLEEKLRAEFGRQFDADENPQSNLMGVSPRSSISSLGSIERQNSFSSKKL